jgi:5-methylcytosine-specific restriction endonuclease McrA
MFEQLRTAIAALESVVREFEPGVLDAPGAVRAVELFVQGEHLCAAGKAFAAGRVEVTGAHRGSGERTAGHWLARTSGVGVGAAMRVIQTAQALDALAATRTAFCAGRLSETQAVEIAAAASKDPSAEERLLGAARTSSMKGLRDRCREVRAAAEADDEAWADRLHATRHVYQWTDLDGAHRADVRLDPHAGAYFHAALEAETDRIFRDARAAGRDEPRAAYAADALLALVTRGPTKAPEIHAVIDDTARIRGYARPDERCDIRGLGRVPIATINQLLDDGARLRDVPADGTHLDGITRDDRYIPADLAAWLDITYPVCGVPGCDIDFRLERDHVVALAHGGRTTKDNLWRLCTHHHRLKHRAGWRVVGTPHHWNLVPPAPDPDPPDDPDPP